MDWEKRDRSEYRDALLDDDGIRICPTRRRQRHSRSTLAVEGGQALEKEKAKIRQARQGR